MKTTQRIAGVLAGALILTSLGLVLPKWSPLQC